MTIKVIEKPELASWVSPQSNKNLPIHNWFKYKHSFSKELVTYLIDKFYLQQGDWVLDPFCGGGTTLLTCKESEINARGFDILPFSVFLTNVKNCDHDSKVIKQYKNIFKKMLRNNKNRINGKLPEIPLLKKAFSADVEEKLIKIKDTINRISKPEVRDFFNLGLLNIVESVSNTSKDGGFLRIIERDVNANEIENLFFDRLDSMVNSLIQHNESKQSNKVFSSAKLGDARKLPTDRKFDAVITSPPYPNRHDYTRIYSLEMVFDFVSSNDELKKIRYDTLRSHVEARKKYRVKDYIPPTNLKRLVSDIKENGTNNPQILGMLEGYFEDMYLALSEMSRCLKNNGKVGLVVSNVRFAGVNVPVDELLAEIG